MTTPQVTDAELEKIISSMSSIASRHQIGGSPLLQIPAVDLKYWIQSMHAILDERQAERSDANKWKREPSKCTAFDQISPELRALVMDRPSELAVMDDVNFKREERHVVIKIKDLKAVGRGISAEEGFRAYLKQYGITPHKCVVVEHDWPEYEHVWKMIQDRMDGRHSKPREVTDEMVNRAAKLIADTFAMPVTLTINELSRAILETCNE